MNRAALCSTGNFPATVLTENAGAIARADTGIVLAPSPGLIQPVGDVAEYLAQRRPQAHYRLELPLFVTLPEEIRADVTEKLAACERVQKRVADQMSVTRAVLEVLAQDRFSRQHWSPKRFRTQFDDYVRTGDWVCLVNRAKCNTLWKKTSFGLADEFLDFFAAQYLARYARADAKRQAVLALHRHWKTGRNQHGDEQVIPGYAEGWKQRNRVLVPEGWTYWNLMRQIKAREKFKRAEQALLHDSTAAALDFLPHTARTRDGMRFLEEVTFDDVRFDYLILNTENHQSEELWALVARDSATSVVLGFVLYPASQRADGTVTHLGAKQMKELAGQLLEIYPLPPYTVYWKVERGTATLAAGVKAALGELFGHRIVVSYTKMLGGKSPVGYDEKKKGNSRGKASHEAHNRLFHTQGSFLPGQTGNHYDVRPADLNARCAEASQISQDALALPAHLRGEVRYPLLTLPQARTKVREFCLQQNFRDDHALENFEEVLEWFNPADGQLHSSASVPHPLPPGARIIKRMERPVERAARLIASVSEWTPCSPAVVVAFLEHTEKWVPLNPKGEIVFDHEGRQLTFVNGGTPLPTGTTKVLVYFRADDPRLIHLTDGRGAVLGTWVRKGKVRFQDQEALADAMRYTHAAQAAAAARARELAAPQLAELEALRAHNAALREFTEITDAPTAARAVVTAPVGEALTAVAAAVKADQKTAAQAERDQARESEAARKNLLDAFE